LSTSQQPTPENSEVRNNENRNNLTERLVDMVLPG
jgi:hypothetical protein